MSTKFLFLDNRLYEYVRAFRRRLNQPLQYAGNPIMEPELPQEFNRVLLYGSVIRDPDTGLFRMWYSSSAHEPKSVSHLLYAESDDGYVWRKPSLDIVPGTNIVMDDDCKIHGPTIILDQDEADAAKRYKMVARRGRGTLAGYVSGDGIHWKLLRDEPLIYADSDCQIGFFRDPESGLYQTSFRDACPDRRVWRSESEDFLTWRRPVLAMEPDIHDPIQTQIYSLQMTPYGAYVLGWLHRYSTWEADRGPTKMNGNWDIELAFSRGGYCWHRPAQGENFIPRDPGGWTAGLISPASSPLFFDDEIRFYFAGCEREHGDEYSSKRFRIGVASLQPDRFLSLDAGDQKAEIMTRAFATREPALFLNVAATGGTVRAELRDVDGVPIPGYELDNCVPVEADATAAQVHWRGNPSPAAFIEKPIRLYLTATRSSLYSATFADAATIGDYRNFKEIRCLRPEHDLE